MSQTVVQEIPKGHPSGLKSLFLTEMWERLGFYLMLGILYLYITDSERGGLGMSNASAGEIYGTYMAFVYFTPFLGGMIADRLLGYRRSVLIGGLLLAAGYFALGIRSMPTFYGGLTLLCLGNGLFKPNISAMVGNLYAPDDPRRDAGFNIFYMGINIGATFAALLAAPLRNYWNFNFAFAAAGAGMLIGVLVLVFTWRQLGDADRQPVIGPDDASLKQVAMTILLPAAGFGAVGYFVGKNLGFVADTIGPVTFAFIVGMLPVMAYFGLIVKRANAEEKPGLAALIPVYIAGGAFFMVLHLSGGLMTVFAEHNTDRRAEWIPSATEFYAQKAMPSYFTNAGPGLERPDERTLLIVPDATESMFGARILNETSVTELSGRSDEGVALQDPAATDVETGDRFLINRIFPDANVAISQEQDSHGVSHTSVRVTPEKAASSGEALVTKTIDGQDYPVVLVSDHTFDAVYDLADETTGRLAPGKWVRLLNAEMITGFLNPLFVVIITPLVVWFFAFRVKTGKPINTAHKIFYGMLITTAAILVMAIGSWMGQDGAIKTSMLWMVLFYLIITFGELCLSPMGLSLVTKLAPKRLVGLMMGGWFLATSIGNKMSGFISGLVPSTLMFVILAAAILAVAGFIFLMLPRLDKAIKKYGA